MTVECAIKRTKIKKKKKKEGTKKERKRPGKKEGRKGEEARGRSGRGIELILLNVTHALLQRGGATPVPFVPGGNKRRFHPREMLPSYCLLLAPCPDRFPLPSFPARPPLESNTRSVLPSSRPRMLPTRLPLHGDSQK